MFAWSFELFMIFQDLGNTFFGAVSFVFPIFKIAGDHSINKSPASTKR